MTLKKAIQSQGKRMRTKTKRQELRRNTQQPENNQQNENKYTPINNYI